VVTGGGGGLGAALGGVFAGAGASVALLDIDESAAREKAVARAGEYDVPTTALQVDVGDPDSIQDAAEHVARSLGGCDILCANVGVQQFGAIDQLTDDDWNWVLNVNVLGTIRTVRVFLPLIRQREGWRRILLTSSVSALAPAVRMAAYQTSKFAVMGFGETLRRELAPEGIGVTVLFPAGMLTGHLQSSEAARPSELIATGAREEDLSEMLADMPMGPDDLTTPEHAVRNVLQDLDNDVPFSVTHGSVCTPYTLRREAIEAALERMERS
jgi:NAD(P)-dependent dehydrogenase (short-subunit alcohol dehydrogenase family)